MKNFHIFIFLQCIKTGVGFYLSISYLLCIILHLTIHLLPFLTHARFECHIFSACTCSVELHPIVGVRPRISAIGRGFIQWFPTDLESPDETDRWKGEVLRFWGLDGNLAKTSPNCSNFDGFFERWKQVSKSKGIYLFSLESRINSFLKNRMIIFSREIFYCKQKEFINGD